MKNKVTVIIPAKNEESTIGKIISRVKPFVDEIIVVDGHSTDKTREIAEELGAKVILDNKKGKGAAMRLALNEVSGSITVFIDADGSHDPGDIPNLITPILEGKADHVSASRMRGGSDELHGDFSKFVRMVGSDIITLAINYRFNVRLTDSQNGFRAIKTEVVRGLGLRENITTIEQEMIIKTLKKKFRLVEIPSHEYKRECGNSLINVRKVWPRYVYAFIKYLYF
ncbi:MAG: glycosyltransferase family 2 protein [Candidatus Omnitrophica bacterium]|nr:glycosyltransferase family 2 protein [Candidatus Omnitrophota bacterium]